MGMKARTVCCGMLVDAEKAPKAKTKAGKELLVCNQQCKKCVEMATPEQIKEISATKLE